tara:strand:+ start:4494 stop:4847 length:354 start_codon:yes stop_codon:yes gene_type:complete
MGSDIVRDRIEEMLQEKQWTFAEMQDMSALVDTFAERIYTDMSAKEKLDFVWQDIGEDFQRILITRLKEDVAIEVKELLMNANINFNGDDKNEIPKGSLGRKSHQRLKANTKKTSEE